MNEIFEVRDQREKGWYFTDNEFLNGYAKFIGIYAVGVYNSLCRHANKNQKSWPSIEKIKTELDIGKNSTIEGIKRLEFFDIIKKVRVGKQCTNRYILTKKSDWKIISEVCLKDYSEVCDTNFKGLLDKLHGFVTQTSNSKKTQKKENPKEKDLSPIGEIVTKTISIEDPKIIELTELLYSRVKENYSFLVEKKTEKQWQADYKEMDRINRIDGREFKIIKFIILWSQNDSFWKQNIRSVKKLRKQFDTLMVRAKGQVDERGIKDYD